MRCRAPWPGPWRPCATRSGTSSCGHGCSVSRTTRRSRGYDNAGDSVDLDAVGTLGTDSLAQTVADRERLALLRADLRDLPERQRSALVLRRAGLSHAEIAVVIDCSARAVKQAIFEARAALHECAEGRTMLCADVQRACRTGTAACCAGGACARTSARAGAAGRSRRRSPNVRRPRRARPGAPRDRGSRAAGPCAPRSQGRAGVERGHPPAGAGVGGGVAQRQSRPR